MKHVLFICTGNTCRSPMAEALLRHHGGDQFRVRSAGLFAPDGGAPAAEAVEVLRDRGIEMEHRTKRLDRALIEWADIVLTMTESHKRTVLQQFPESVGKVYTLKEYADDETDASQIWGRLESLYAELETKRALSADADVEALEKDIRSLEEALPSRDISDPFGMDANEYRRTYTEIEKCVLRFIAAEEEEH